MDNSKIYKETTTLNLSNQALKTLPEDIGKYINLKELDLSGNELKTLPISLKSLKKLEKLNISNNRLTRLPDFFRDFRALKELDISYNPLVEIPYSLWKLEGLKSLNISGLNLKELPVEIGNLKTLSILNISDLGLFHLPESIGYLKELTELWSSGNLLFELPHTFKNFEKLKRISFARNKFEELPKNIFSLKALIYFNVSDNRLKRVSSEIKHLRKLTHLDISTNKIKVLPVALTTLNLKRDSFHYDGNPFSRTVLAEINKMFPTKENISERKTARVLQEHKKKATNNSKIKLDKAGIETTYSLGVFFKIGIPIMLLILIYFFISNVNNENINSKEEIIHKESTREEEGNYDTTNRKTKTKVKRDSKKEYEDYILAKENLDKSLKRMLKKTKEVFVYTNDPAKLQLTIRPNAKFNKKGYQDNHSNKRKAKYINKFLNNKRYGYSVDINNGRTKFAQLWLHDSIILNNYAKKYRVVRYYRMTPKEKEYNIQRDKRRIAYRKKPRNDKVFAINRGIVDSRELKNKNFRIKTRAIFTPQDIDITRKENYFYFTSLNANVSKKEFLEAVEKFKEMFITKGNPDELCFLKTLTVTQE